MHGEKVRFVTYIYSILTIDYVNSNQGLVRCIKDILPVRRLWKTHIVFIVSVLEDKKQSLLGYMME